jgi:Nif-specific regulatory protein
MLAYLVIREGSKYSDVRRLTPGQSLILGRAPTCDVVLHDERCSRQHAEVFFADDGWRLRDLGSRNGTAVGAQPLAGEHALRPGDMIRLGRSQVVFVHELSQAFLQGGTQPPVAAGSLLADETVREPAELDAPSSQRSADSPRRTGPTTIMHRRGHTRFLEPQGDESNLPRAGRAANRLCRLAFELATCGDEQAIARTALQGLFESLPIDAGGVLLLPAEEHDGRPGEPLTIAASRSDTELPYQSVSPTLARTVLGGGEAVLARNMLGDTSAMSVAGGSADSAQHSGNADRQRDSDGRRPPTECSVICAPLRRAEQVFGLLHLYSTRDDRAPDADDLDFALAVAETLAVALENLTQRRRLADDLDQVRDQNEQLREQLGEQSEIVGRSPVMARVRSQIARVAASNATVLVCGESGVGKELVARALHLSSARKEKLFVCLNCAALTESLLESELFGHERGAFTGATDRKIGKFEAAHGGTIFLDEIGEMSPHLQAKFLRVLEGHPFERVGGSQPVTADVRVIAASNRDLEKEVEQNNFRRDLYFRLRVVEIVVPGLRKRPDDIPILANYFLDRFNREAGRRIRGFTAEAMEQMRRYRWPGNVREMKNVIERAVVLCEGPQIEVGDLMLSKLATSGETNEASVPTDEFTPLTLEELERRHIRATLVATGWNKSQTAQILGIERSTLDRKIRRYGLKRELKLPR